VFAARVKMVKQRDTIRSQLAILLVAVVLFMKCTNAEDFALSSGGLWSKLAWIVFLGVGCYMVAAFLLTLGMITWLVYIEPYLRHLIRSPRETIKWTLGTLLVIALLGWWLTPVGPAVKGRTYGEPGSRGVTYCEPDSRGGTYCYDD
jgi:predicted MFS family arabinose efflux permease